MRRGEVWWASLAPPFGRRPVLLLSRDSAYERRPLIILTPISTRGRNLASEVLLGPADGLPSPCFANLDNIFTNPVDDLDRYLTTLSPEKMHEVEEAIHFVLGLET